MTEETKKALEGMHKAMMIVDEICRWEEFKPNKPAPTLDIDALEDALKIERQARIKYHTLAYSDMGWTQQRIDEWLKKVGLK